MASFLGLAIGAFVLLVVANSWEDDLQIGAEEVLAEDAPDGTLAGLPPVPPPPTPTPRPPALVDPFAAFALEPVTDEGVFSLPTAFAVGGEGELYVGHDFGIAVARDTSGDGFYDWTQPFGLEGGWVFGLAYHEGSVYASVAGEVLRLTDVDGDGVADEVETLVSGLPHNQYGGHSNSGLAVGEDGRLYMGIGGTSDHGPELEPFGGTILSLDFNGGEPELFARGFRNPYDLAFCPDGRLYAVDNGPDQVSEELALSYWDEVNEVVAGGHYGYPEQFGMVLDETGTISPVALVAQGAGITGITCYGGNAYPGEYQGDLFVTLWGTFMHPEETGRRVMRVQLKDTPKGIKGKPAEFADGFGHPIDIVQDLEGHLLVLDWERGQIFRIRYVGV